MSTIGSLASARQARNVRVGMDLSATVEVLLREFGNEQFQRDQIYVLTRLSDEHDHILGFDGLPDEVRLKVWRVGFAYENLRMLLAFGLLDQRIVLTIANYRIKQVWAVLEPYIRAERVRRGTTYLDFFENAKVEADRVTPEEVYQKLKLKRAEVTPLPEQLPEDVG